MAQRLSLKLVGKDIDELRERADKIQTRLVAARNNASPGQVELTTDEFDAAYCLILDLREQAFT